jgi:hypothetical protein
MTDTELKLNIFIKRDIIGKYVIIAKVRISLKDKLIALTKVIMCQGITCYRGKRPSLTN